MQRRGKYRGIAVEVKSHPDAEPLKAWVVETGGEYTEIRDVRVLPPSAGKAPDDMESRRQWATEHQAAELALWEEAWAQQSKDKTPVYV